MKTTIAFLRKNEWTMGNGQCHVCEGCGPRVGWGPWTKIGHKPGCCLGQSLEELGETVEWEHDPPPLPPEMQAYWDRFDESVQKAFNEQVRAIFGSLAKPSPGSPEP